MSKTSTTAGTRSDATADDIGTSPPPGDTGRSRRWPRLIGAAVVLALVVGGTTFLLTGTQDQEPTDEEPEASVSTTTVQVRDIVATTTLDGTLTHADERTVEADAQGIVTSLPAVGTTVEAGETLYEVDGQPVVLLPADVPLWRELSVDSEPGEDVRALEEALVAMGHADAVASTGDPADLTVDEEFTDVTAAAVADFREAAGLSEGETIAPGDVVVASSAVRVAGVQVELGDRVQPGLAVLTVTGTDRVVTVELDAADQGLLAEGDTVAVELPDGNGVEGTVTGVSSVAEARTGSGQNAETTYVVPVEITLAEGGTAFDEAPVEVVVTDEVATDVLAVPVEAVLALAEGGYALEVVETDGSTSLVAVTLGDFSDGWVGVTGDGLTEGTEVVTA